ncbi:MAG: glycogen/starch synthase [Gammaproteobacteria bacterium]
MNVLMVCSEFAPWAKTGGLADAVTGLANALVARGHDVRVLLPRYAHLPGAGVKLRRLRAGRHRFGEIETAAGRAGPRVYLLELDELTADSIYTSDARDAGRFIRLASAALELPAALNWRPDILHCHDWHAALAPVLNRTAGGARLARTVLTLHNVGYQGVFAADVLEEYATPQLRAGIPADALTGGDVNFLRAGVHTADVVTTVSPTYAAEIRTPQFGMGLEDVLNGRGTMLVGILNGVDYDVWDPRSDPFLAAHFDATNLATKRELKNTLGARLGLQVDATTPLIGIVTRLAPQKGIDLLAAALPGLLRETRATFAVLGSGDVALASTLAGFALEQPKRVAFTEGYDEALAHLIFAASDLTLVPSRYEPCGLTQMYALRYGTIPVVRATGGLADTITHFDPATGTGNGGVFRDADVDGLLWGLRTALGWFDDRAAWSRLVANAMAVDFSWGNQVPQYERLYRSLL